MPKKKIPHDLRSLARGYTKQAMLTVGGILTAGAKESDRLHAAEIMMERGWGKAAQPVTGEDGEGAIEITVRVITEGKK